MISVIHTPAEERIGKAGEYLIPAGGRLMEMDWDRISDAFGRAVERVGWDADIELQPDKQYARVRFAGGSPETIASQISAFYDAIEEVIGTEAFMSIWIDFSFLP